MTLSIHADVPPLRQAEDGVVRIANTRIPLERVVRAFLNGMTPEQIAHDFDVLKVEDVYAVINYYLHHREEVDAYMADAEKDAAKIKDEIEMRCDSAGIRARLLARRKPEANP
jgi:uncharacterized protein (DUF433 family)